MGVLALYRAIIHSRWLWITEYNAVIDVVGVGGLALHAPKGHNTHSSRAANVTHPLSSGEGCRPLHEQWVGLGMSGTSTKAASVCTPTKQWAGLSVLGSCSGQYTGLSATPDPNSPGVWARPVTVRWVRVVTRVLINNHWGLINPELYSGTSLESRVFVSTTACLNESVNQILGVHWFMCALNLE